MKPTTIEIPDYITDILRSHIQAATPAAAVFNVQHEPNPMHLVDALKGLLAFRMEPLYMPEYPALDRLSMFHVEFAKFPADVQDPQISCHMIGHVHWNASITQELVSIRWRFNLLTQEQTNAYVQYL